MDRREEVSSGVQADMNYKPPRHSLAGIPVTIDQAISGREIRMNPDTLTELYSIGLKDQVEILVIKREESGDN